MLPIQDRVKVLTIGINKFDPASGVNTLRGCVNDTRRSVEKIYKPLLGVPAHRIMQLEDNKATQAGIMAAIKWFTTKENDDGSPVYRYLHVSSHGSYLKHTDVAGVTTETQITIPYDMNWRNKTYITDLVWREMFNTFSAEDTILAVFDTCHSAGVHRSLDPALADAEVLSRFIAPPEDLAPESEPADRGITVEAVKPKAKAKAKAKVKTGEDTDPALEPEATPPAPKQSHSAGDKTNHLYIFTCGPKETASDAKLADPYNDNEKRYCGAGSNAFQNSLIKSGGEIPLEEIHQDAIKILKSQGFRQNPESEISQHIAEVSFNKMFGIV